MADEEIHLPPLTLLQQTSLVLAQLGELPYGAGAAELTCISEEGIADVSLLTSLSLLFWLLKNRKKLYSLIYNNVRKQMDIPDHLLEELDFAADCITSCDKVTCQHFKKKIAKIICDEPFIFRLKTT